MTDQITAAQYINGKPMPPLKAVARHPNFIELPIMGNYDIKIGIDPDCDKSGLACNLYGLTVEVIRFFDLYSFLQKFKNMNRHKIIIIIEAGWLNKKSNWHKSPSNNVAQLIAKKVGANHETGRKIVEMCQHLGLLYTLVIPKSKKTTGQEFKMLTGIDCKNQEMIDAAMLIL